MVCILFCCGVHSEYFTVLQRICYETSATDRGSDTEEYHVVSTCISGPCSIAGRNELLDCSALLDEGKLVNSTASRQVLSHSFSLSFLQI